jgi:nicotinate-nucleotide adenylyltransferase
LKIGIIGGAFDPIHLGHLALAHSAQKALDLDKIIFLPAGNHPFKKDNTLCSAEERYHLIEKAIKGVDNFELSRLDMQEDQISYTADLVRKLQEIYSDNELYLIVGDDIVQDLPLWHDWEWLIRNIQFVVARRPDTDRDRWINLDYLEYFIFIDMKPFPISSTKIRQAISEDDPIEDFVPQIIKDDVIRLYKKREN